MSDHERCPTRKVRVDGFEIDVNTMQALAALIHWINGFECGGKCGTVPGHFELVMLFRSLKDFEAKKEGEE